MAEISKDRINEIFDKFIKNAEEERELALERYRRQDILMESAEDFVLQGKNTVEYLKTAAQRSDAMLDVAKLIITMNSKDATGSNTQALAGDELKKQIKEAVDKQMK